jgi:creatinine amidohydrolase/Fe(II)-dependent formamide hydrolase-like protein
MIEPNNGQALSQHDKSLLPKGDPARYTGETLRRTRPKTYRKVVELLASGVGIKKVGKLLKVSEHTVNAVKIREAATIEIQKKSLASIFYNVATTAGERMEELAGKASLRDATVAAGVSTDKMLALIGQLPSVQVAVVNMPSAEEREERKRMHDALDAIARSLKERTPDIIRCFT